MAGAVEVEVIRVRPSMMRDCEKPSDVMLLLIMTGAVEEEVIREVTELAVLPSMMRDCEKPSGVMLLLITTGAVDVAAIREVTELTALPPMMIDCEKRFDVMLLIMTVAVGVEAMGFLRAVIELAALPSSLLMRDRGLSVVTSAVDVGALRAVTKLTAVPSSLLMRDRGGQFGVTPSLPRMMASCHSEISETSNLKCCWAGFLQQAPSTLLQLLAQHLHNE